jgi:hypothetical protein
MPGLVHMYLRLLFFRLNDPILPNAGLKVYLKFDKQFEPVAKLG